MCGSPYNFIDITGAVYSYLISKLHNICRKYEFIGVDLQSIKWKLARLRVRYQVNPRRLWVRYMVGLTIIFLLIVTSHQSSLNVIKTGTDDVYLIKLSSQQAVVSQQLHLTVNQYRLRPTDNIRAQLEGHIASFMKSHEILVLNIGGDKDLQSLYFGEGDLDKDSQLFIEQLKIFIGNRLSSRQAIAAYYFINDFVPEVLLDKLKRSAFFHQQNADRDFKALENLQYITLTLSAFILILEFFVIFMPAQKSVARTLDRLQRQKRTLRRARTELVNKNEELNSSYSEMEHAALHDPLTGLANRRYLEQELSKRIQACAKLDGSMAALHIDLDNFKTINDTLGHKAGDHLLKHAARIFTQQARSTDFVSRIGGDEFVILTDDQINEERAARIAQRLINAFARPVMFEGDRLKVSASIGIDLFNPKDKLASNCVSDILSQADVALYMAKEKGRNCYEFFSYEQYQSYLKDLVDQGKSINEKK